ncbi:MAG: sugar phosphate isomerase/epimerase [Lentisphaeria bacterium]|nr:sugar phosphate isomerase/epimerase [Lentisphaeria bacterium]
MARIPIGLELYSVRQDFAADPLGTLKAVAAMGYEGVEFAGPAKLSGAELGEMLRATGLVCCGWHTPYAAVQPDTLAATIALNQAVGNRYVIIPGLPGNLVQSLDDWVRMAGFFNQLAASLKPHGMLTGYHNHHTEFQVRDGGRPWDAFFGNAAPDVIMQLDLGNAMHGGAEVMQILRDYPGRCQTIHLKPYSRKAAETGGGHAGFRPIIGDDDVPWNEVFRFCETAGRTEWYIVEYESDAYPPLEAVERCLKALKAMGR